MIWIGTSGWVYPHWIGPFYPDKLPVCKHLFYYAQHFPTVEMNRSFYRLPTRDQFHALSQQTLSHPGFCFAIKASRYLTHMKKLLLLNSLFGPGDLPLKQKRAAKCLFISITI